MMQTLSHFLSTPTFPYQYVYQCSISVVLDVLKAFSSGKKPWEPWLGAVSSWKLQCRMEKDRHDLDRDAIG